MSDFDTAEFTHDSAQTGAGGGNTSAFHTPSHDAYNQSQQAYGQQSSGFQFNAQHQPDDMNAAQSSGTSSFFQSIRSIGILRSEPRIIGGVLAGVSERWGWDLTLIRVLYAISSFFFPLLLTLYGISWLFLPDRRNNRIHVQELLNARFDIGQFGAIALTVLGLGNGVALPTFFFGFFDFANFGVFAAMFFFTGIIGGTIALITYIVYSAAKPRTSTNQRFTPPSVVQPTPGPTQPTPVTQPNPGTPQTTESTPHPSATLNDTSRTAPSAMNKTPTYPSALPIPAPTWTPVARPRKLSSEVTLLTFGLILIVFASVMWMLAYHAQDSSTAAHVILYGGGTCLLLVSIPLAFAALHDRSAHALLGLSILGMTMALPTALIGSQLIHDHADIQGTHHPYTVYDHTSTHLGMVTDGEWNLSDVPTGDTTHYIVDSVNGDLTIRVRQDQPIEFLIDEVIGSVHAASDNSHTSWVPTYIGYHDAVTFRSVPGVSPVTTIHIQEVFGTVTIEVVDPPAPTPHSDVPQSLPTTADTTQSADRSQSAGTPQSGTTR